MPRYSGPSTCGRRLANGRALLPGRTEGEKAWHRHGSKSCFAMVLFWYSDIDSRNWLVLLWRRFAHSPLDLLSRRSLLTPDFLMDSRFHCMDDGCGEPMQPQRSAKRFWRPRAIPRRDPFAAGRGGPRIQESQSAHHGVARDAGNGYAAIGCEHSSSAPSNTEQAKKARETWRTVSQPIAAKYCSS